MFQAAGQRVHALHDVDLHVKPGSIFGVIGRSGAGKSTLLRCVNLLERPTSGRVIVAGRELSALSERELVPARRSIGMVFQQPQLLASRTIADNVALPLELAGEPRARARERVAELLELVGIADKHDARPAQLSGGQRQRATIARALANRPSVLLCDEATSALDPATKRAILALLRDIQRSLQLTILLITHEMDVALSICEEVAIMSDGRLVEQGPVARLFGPDSSPLARSFLAEDTSAANGHGALHMRVQIRGDAARAQVALAQLRAQHIEVEVIGDVAGID